MDKTAEDEQTRIRLLVSLAMKQAINELIGESRPELIKRAKAKLIALGVAVSEDDFSA